MEMKKVSPRAKTLWMIRNVIWLVIITVAMAVALIFGFGEPGFAVVAIIASVSWLTIAVLLLVFPSLSYKHYSYGYDDKRLSIKSGVIFRHSITAPICQIQDLHFYEGPIMRMLGIGNVMIATGGSNFELIGMNKAEAQALIENLEEKLRARLEEKRNEEI